ncbi:MAG: SusE domain-containing protein [Ginsengibacter sp.]
MKHISKLFFAAILITAFTACNKVADLPHYKNGTTPVLTSSTTTIASTPADSNNVALTLTWTSPAYATDSNNMKYVVQIDSAGGNFSKAVSHIVLGSLSTTFTAKELNSILLNYGYAFGVPYNINVRVISSYANNNEQLISNTLTISITPYAIPPKIAPPLSGHLYLVGDASQGGWNNPVPVPTQEFSKIDSVTYGGVFDLIGGKQYLALPVNGDWSHKFAVADNSIPGLSEGGDFGYDLSSNFPGPATSGLYKIIFNFQSGKFAVTPYTGALPLNLFIVGDATPGGWNNPVPAPSQQFTRLNSSEFEITLPLTGGKQYLLLPVNGDWSHKFAVADNSLPGLAAGGTFGYDLSQNFPGPATDGNYKIRVSFLTNTYTVTKL